MGKNAPATEGKGRMVGCASWCACQCGQISCGCHEGRPPRVEREMASLEKAVHEKEAGPTT